MRWSRSSRCDDELGEAAHVFEGRALGEFDDPVGHGVDEVAVVADEQQGAGPGRQLLLEPGDGVDVEVVGRLVEDQHVGLGQQQTTEGDPHPPTARELGDGSVDGGVLEAETGEDLVGLGLEGVAAHRLETTLDVAVVGEDLVLVGVGVAHERLELAESVRERGELTGAGQHLLHHRAGGGVDEVLREVAHDHVAGAGDRAGVGVGVADEDLDERGLAGPVAADERDAATRTELQGHVLEEGPRAVRARDTAGGQHAELSRRSR